MMWYDWESDGAVCAEAPIGMAGQYWRVLDDGAKCVCQSCGQEKDASEVILTQHTENFDQRKLVCIAGQDADGWDCLDAEWFATAECLGTTDDLEKIILEKHRADKV